MALEKGYFREEGLEDVELIAFADDEAAQIDALARQRRARLKASPDY